MRSAFVVGVVLLAAMAFGCASTERDPVGGAGGESGAGVGGMGGEGGPCAPILVEITSPVGDDAIGSWEVTVEGIIETVAGIVEVSYDVDGEVGALPPQAGPFAFTVPSNGRTVVPLAVRAHMADGCVATVWRTLHFDPSKWVELTQGTGEWLESTVDAPGVDLPVRWSDVGREREAIVPRAVEHVGLRMLGLPSFGMDDVDGSTTITVQNPDLEVWWFNLGVTPPMDPLVISVGRSLRMVPDVAEIDVGDEQWITISNAIRAVWTVDPPAELEPTPPPDRPAVVSVPPRAGARFAAGKPGRYTVRASTPFGGRVGEVTIDVKAIEAPPSSLRELPAFPEGFTANAVDALPDGTLFAGGRMDGSTSRAALIRLAPGDLEWSVIEGIGASDGGEITHVVAGAAGEVYALHDDGLYRVSAAGTVERLLDSGAAGESITTIWSVAGTLYVVIDGFVYALEPASEIWRSLDAWSCQGRATAADAGSSMWLACTGDALLARYGLDFSDFLGVIATLGPVADLALDDGGRLLAATTRGVHRLSDSGTWTQVAGGGPAGEGTILRRSGARLFAGDGRDVWTLSASGRSWVRLPLPPAERLLVAVRDGRIVALDKELGGAVVEIDVGE